MKELSERKKERRILPSSNIFRKEEKGGEIKRKAKTKTKVFLLVTLPQIGPRSTRLDFSFLLSRDPTDFCPRRSTKEKIRRSHIRKTKRRKQTVRSLSRGKERAVFGELENFVDRRIVCYIQQGNENRPSSYSHITNDLLFEKEREAILRIKRKVPSGSYPVRERKTPSPYPSRRDPRRRTLCYAQHTPSSSSSNPAYGSQKGDRLQDPPVFSCSSR